MVATAYTLGIAASAIAARLLKLSEGKDPPLSLAYHAEKPHVGGCTLGGPPKCEGCLIECEMSISCSTDCLTCLSPFENPCYEA